MSGKNINAFCFVTGAMVLVLGARVEAGVTRNKFEDRASQDSYPVDGVRIHADPPIIDTSDLEEPDKGSYPIINGRRKIARIYSVPEIDPEEVAVNYDHFPFISGLQKHDGKSIFDEDFEKGHKEEFPFINGVYRRRKTEEEEEEPKVEDFEKTTDVYPFINGLRNLPGSFEADNGDKTEHSAEDWWPSFEENLPIRKRSVEESQPELNATTTIKPTENNLNVAKERNKWRVVYGERKEGDTKLYEKCLKKPLNFIVNELITEFEFPDPAKNKTNDCIISYIHVNNAQRIGHLENDVVSIPRGGIGQTFATVRITSPNFYLYLYRVKIYGSSCSLQSCQPHHAIDAWKFDVGLHQAQIPFEPHFVRKRRGAINPKEPSVGDFDKNTTSKETACGIPSTSLSTQSISQQTTITHENDSLTNGSDKQNQIKETTVKSESTSTTLNSTLTNKFSNDSNNEKTQLENEPLLETDSIDDDSDEGENSDKNRSTTKLTSTSLAAFRFEEDLRKAVEKFKSEDERKGAFKTHLKWFGHAVEVETALRKDLTFAEKTYRQNLTNVEVIYKHKIDALEVYRMILVLRTRIEELEAMLLPKGPVLARSRAERWKRILKSGSAMANIILQAVLEEYKDEDVNRSISLFSEAVERLYGHNSNDVHHVMDPAVLAIFCNETVTVSDDVLKGLKLSRDEMYIKALKIISKPLPLPGEMKDTKDEYGAYTCIMIRPPKNTPKFPRKLVIEDEDVRKFFPTTSAINVTKFRDMELPQEYIMVEFQNSDQAITAFNQNHGWLGNVAVRLQISACDEVPY